MNMPTTNQIRDRPTKPLNLGRAIMWMMRHPGSSLIDNAGHLWRYSCDDKFELDALDGAGWYEAIILLPFMLDHTFTRPVSATKERDRLLAENRKLQEQCAGNEKTIQAAKHKTEEVSKQLVATEVQLEELRAELNKLVSAYGAR